MLLLKDETLKLPAPKNLFAEDIIICTDVAIFATTKAPIEYQGPCNKTDLQEYVMMRVRWKTFNFIQQFVTIHGTLHFTILPIAEMVFQHVTTCYHYFLIYIYIYIVYIYIYNFLKIMVTCGNILRYRLNCFKNDVSCGNICGNMLISLWRLFDF